MRKKSALQDHCYVSHVFVLIYNTWASLIAQLVKNPPVMQETPVQFLGREDPLEKGKAMCGFMRTPTEIKQRNLIYGINSVVFI